MKSDWQILDLCLDTVIQRQIWIIFQECIKISWQSKEELLSVKLFTEKVSMDWQTSRCPDNSGNI